MFCRNVDVPIVKPVPAIFMRSDLPSAPNSTDEMLLIVPFIGEPKARFVALPDKNDSVGVALIVVGSVTIDRATVADTAAPIPMVSCDPPASNLTA